MSGSIQSDYVVEMMNEFHACAKQNGVNTILFLGPQIPDNCKEIVDECIIQNCSKQFSTIYQYTHFVKPDAIIITYGSLSSLFNDQSKSDFLQMFSNIPCLILEDEFQEQDIPSIVADNYQGMKACIEHLIVDHGFQKVAFLSGPKNNYDANERLRAYLDAMREHNLSVTDGMIAYGNFSDHDDVQVKYLLDQTPGLEAIACADDLMAKSCYHICETRNIIIGKDIAITGFDDPSMASSICKGEKVASEKVPTLLRKRVSCSCAPFGILDCPKFPQKQLNRHLENTLYNLCPNVFESLHHLDEGEQIKQTINEYCSYIVKTVFIEHGEPYNAKVLMNLFKNLLAIPFVFNNQLLEGFSRFLVILKDNASLEFSKKLLNEIITDTRNEILTYHINTIESNIYESNCKSWFVPLFIGNLIKGSCLNNTKELFISIMEEMKKCPLKNLISCYLMSH